MAKYIDKDAVIEKINKLYSALREHPGTCGTNYILGFRQAGYMIIDFCNTLEVKAVDLDKVFLDEYSKFSNDVDAMDYAFPIDLADYKDFAKHFFELGLKTQKGE